MNENIEYTQREIQCANCGHKILLPLEITMPTGPWRTIKDDGIPVIHPSKRLLVIDRVSELPKVVGYDSENKVWLDEEGREMPLFDWIKYAEIREPRP